MSKQDHIYSPFVRNHTRNNQGSFGALFFCALIIVGLGLDTFALDFAHMLPLRGELKVNHIRYILDGLEFTGIMKRAIVRGWSKELPPSNEVSNLWPRAVKLLPVDGS